MWVVPPAKFGAAFFATRYRVRVTAKRSIADARNFRCLDDEQLLTAGQPNEDQLEDAARQGVKVVINLALHDDPRYSLRDEAGSVRALGMQYIHIPVQFSEPTENNLRAFFDAMDAHKGEKVLVHCAANFRVTAFIGLYRVIREGWTTEKAFEPMRSVWEPDGVWRVFIDRMLAHSIGHEATDDGKASVPGT